jgi:hypothetical protein
VTTTMQDGETLPSTPAGPEFARTGANAGPPPSSQPIPASAGGRQRYVVGVFFSRSDASRAVAGLASGPWEVLVVSAAAIAWDAPERVTFRHVDPSALASNLTAILNASPAFSVLGPNGGLAPVKAGRPAEMTRHFDALVHHLASDATAILVQAGGQEAHLRASRILLDGKCAVLLTHDVKQSDGRTEPAHAEADECCQTCTDRTCGRFPRPIG